MCKEIFNIQFKLLNIDYKESGEHFIFGIFLGGENMANNTEQDNSFASVTPLTFESIAAAIGAIIGLGIGNVIDSSLKVLVFGITQDIVCFVAPLIGMSLGAVSGYKVVKMFTREENNLGNGNSPA